MVLHSTLLANQPDFAEQLGAIEEVVQAYNRDHGTGHVVEFVPEFHPELNPIERFWATLKRYLRQNFTYSAPKLRALLPLTLEEIGFQGCTGRFFRKSKRMMEVFRLRPDSRYTLGKWFAENGRGT